MPINNGTIILKYAIKNLCNMFQKTKVFFCLKMWKRCFTMPGVGRQWKKESLLSVFVVLEHSFVPLKD